MRTISEIDNEMDKCKKEVATLEKRFNELGLEKAEALLSEKFPIGRHLHFRGGKWKIGGYVFEYGDPRVKVYKIKKNGQPSARPQILWYFELERAELIEL